MESIREINQYATKKNFLKFHNDLYGWKITDNFKTLEDLTKKTPLIIRIEIIISSEKNQYPNKKCICFKDIPYDSYKLMKYTLLKNNALALILKKKLTENDNNNKDDYEEEENDDYYVDDKKILVIFKFYKNKNNIQLQYFTYINNENTQHNNQHESELSELPLDDIDSIVENDNYPLEKEWLKVVTTDHFTLSVYGLKYFETFIKEEKYKLICNTYNKCIHFIKKDIKKI